MAAMERQMMLSSLNVVGAIPDGHFIWWYHNGPPFPKTGAPRKTFHDLYSWYQQRWFGHQPRISFQHVQGHVKVTDMSRVKVFQVSWDHHWNVSLCAKYGSNQKMNVETVAIEVYLCLNLHSAIGKNDLRGSCHTDDFGSRCHGYRPSCQRSKWSKYKVETFPFPMIPLLSIYPPMQTNSLVSPLLAIWPPVYDIKSMSFWQR